MKKTKEKSNSLEETRMELNSLRKEYAELSDELFKIVGELVKQINQLEDRKNLLNKPQLSHSQLSMMAHAEEAYKKGKNNYLSREILQEKYYINPERHQHLWSESEDELLERNLMGLINAASLKHKRHTSAIMFRISRLLRDAGLEP